MVRRAISDLFRRRVPHILGMYLGGGWAAIEFIGFLVDRYGMSPNLIDVAILVLGLLLPSVALLAYLHGRPGADAWGRAEKVVIPANLAIVVAVAIATVSRTDLSRQSVVSDDRTERQITFTSNVYDVALSPDGNTVAYLAGYRTGTRMDGEVFRLFVQDLAGGDAVQLAEGVTGEPRWSPDGTRVEVQSFNGSALNAFPRLGGNASVLCCEQSGSLSHSRVPGTATIVVPVFQGNLRPFLYAGSHPETLEYPFDPQSAVRDGVDGTLIDLAGRVRDVAFVDASPGGDWIAFLATDSTGEFKLGTVSVDGSTINVFEGISGLDEGSRPRWSPAGTTVYYFRPDGRGSTLFGVTINRRTGLPADDPRVVEIGFPEVLGWDISRDGRRLVYAGGVREGSQLTMARFQPGDTIALEVPFTNDSYSYSAPAFSPDGESLAYGKAGEGPPDVYVRSATGDVERNVTGGRLPSGSIEAMSWSPDGDRLAVLTVDRVGVYDSLTLSIVNLGSGRIRPVWGDRAESGERFGGMAREVPAWSPDGSEVLMLLAHGGRPIAIDLATGRTTEWMAEEYDPDGFRSDPVFSPQADQIALFQSTTRIYDRNGALIRLVHTRTDRGSVWGEPVLWAQDGHIYTITRPPSAVHRISPGAAIHELHGRVPFQCWSQVALSPDATTLLCALPQARSNVFVIDNFDPASDG